ncbi:MAG TPA: type II secretion system protein GspG [Polyangia bacterium]|nr:type II secretion system protein GspG [Polyangia bacterium]
MNREMGRLVRMAERGMTLIEIMVVVAIIGLVMGGVGVVAFQRYKKAQIETCKTEIRELKAAIQHWVVDNTGESCPKTLQELYSQKYVNKAPKDPWNQEFLYTCPSPTNTDDGFDISSKGPDKQPGTEDDIKSAGL